MDGPKPELYCFENHKGGLADARALLEALNANDFTLAAAYVALAIDALEEQFWREQAGTWRDMDGGLQMFPLYH